MKHFLPVDKTRKTYRVLTQTNRLCSKSVVLCVRQHTFRTRKKGEQGFDDAAAFLAAVSSMHSTKKLPHGDFSGLKAPYFSPKCKPPFKLRWNWIRGVGCLGVLMVPLVNVKLTLTHCWFPESHAAHDRHHVKILLYGSVLDVASLFSYYDINNP